MEWSKLLNPTRLRKFFGLPESRRMSGELRSEFERDYDRALYSSPVRRLRDKAQVFPLEQHDSIRTRLTHSLEVSVAAENLALAAMPHLPGVDLERPEEQKSIAWIARTCGLMHDLGNPPFGHAGEKAISSWFDKKNLCDDNFRRQFHDLTDQQKKDFLAFEGNAQTIRLVSHSQLLLDNYGLNLTIGTLASLCKYLPPSHLADNKNQIHALKKPGYFSSEEEIVNVVREQSSTGAHRHPITYLVEAADDIVYSTVDLEDGLKKDVLDWSTIEREMKDCPIAKEILQEADSDLVGTELRGKAFRDARAVILRTKAIGRMAHAVVKTFEHRYSQIMNGDYDGELVADDNCAVKEFIHFSKDRILGPYLYTHPSILKLEIRGREVIHDLMDVFWEAMDELTLPAKTKEYSGKLYLLLSENYRHDLERRLNEGGGEKSNQLYQKLQLITDQISGMTDTYICMLHKDLFNG